MDKSANLYSPFSASETLPYGKRMFGLDMVNDPTHIFHLVQQDHGLEKDKKRSLLHMLNSPEVFDHLLAGTAGVLIAKAISSYSDMSPPARTLLSLAGFGIGNIIYNNLNERKFTTYDHNTGIAKIRTHGHE
jgi:hypothetical protein